MNIVLAIIVISIIIIAHEFGHFIMAKVNGVMVLEFSIGLGPKIFKVKFKETEFNIKLLPFGGACIMLGDDLLNSQTELEDEDKEEYIELEDEEEKATLEAIDGLMEQYDESRSLNSKSVWARIAIYVAGPVFNFILAFIFAVLIIGAVGYDPSYITQVSENTPAYEAGLKSGDLIKKINGKNITFSREFSMETTFNPGKPMEITYEREGAVNTVLITPEYKKTVSYMTGITILSDGMINAVEDNSPAKEAGIRINDIIKSIDGVLVDNSSQIVNIIQSCQGKTMQIIVRRDGKDVELSVTPKMMERQSYVYGLYLYGNRVKTTPFNTVVCGFKEVGYWINAVIRSLKIMILGDVSLDDFAGPVGVVSTIGNVVEQSKKDGMFYVILNLLNMTVMISANLGVMNLLPLPALDGGRLVFAFIEALRGKPVSKEKEGMVHFVGMILLLIFMVAVMFNDIKNLF